MRVQKLLRQNTVQAFQQGNIMKRFYKSAQFTVNAKPAHGLHNYLITLDDRTVKTSYRNLLAVPSRILALLVTAEFNRQLKHIKSGEMPMLALCRTAVDADIQGHLTEHLKHSIYEYLKTDSLLFVDDCYASAHEQHALPIIRSFQQRFRMIVEPSRTISPPKLEISREFTEWIDSLNNWQLIGLETMTIWMKSTMSAYGVLESVATAGEVQKAAYLEEITQMQYNGEVDEKLMEINSIKLMVSCGEMMFCFGHNDIK